MAIEGRIFRVNTLRPEYIRTDMTAVNSPDMLNEWNCQSPAKRVADLVELKDFCIL